MTADGEQRRLQHEPKLIAGYLYLPPELIKAITGWEVEYVEVENTVYIYSYREGEAPRDAEQ